MKPDASEGEAPGIESTGPRAARRPMDPLEYARIGSYAQWASVALGLIAVTLSATAAVFLYKQVDIAQGVAEAQARAAAAQARAATAQAQAVQAQTDAVTAHTWRLVLQVQTELSRTFIEKPKLWPYFDLGEPPPDGDTAENKELFNQIMAVAELSLDLIDSFEDEAFYKIPGMAKGQKERELWEAYFIRLFKKSPALCMRMSETGALYRERVRELASDGCATGTYKVPEYRR